MIKIKIKKIKIKIKIKMEKNIKTIMMKIDNKKKISNDLILK